MSEWYKAIRTGPFLDSFHDKQWTRAVQSNPGRRFGPLLRRHELTEVLREA